jgi:hypothetical protein
MSATNGLGDPRALRTLLIEALDALPPDVSSHGGAPDPRFVYLPPAHVKALRPDSMVVIGMRGAGKSFWWSALQEPRVRALVSQLTRTEIGEQTQVRAGFGEKPEITLYPDRDTLAGLLRDGTEPRLIWRTVMVHSLAPNEHPLHRVGAWRDRIAWVRENSEAVAGLLAARDLELDRQATWFLVLFDALDRSATNWEDMHRLIRGLLETALDFRPYRRIRVKCFLRTDQLDESRVADFPDASKVVSARVELSWPRTELYGLLWQHLANASSPEAGQAAEVFRANARDRFSVQWEKIRLQGLEAWRMSLTQDFEATQRNLFHALAGEQMGNDRRRGFPYTWIPGHLADAANRTSPRSFLAALRAAVTDTEQRYPSHNTALHYESIKRGVQKASQIRVSELKEDYPWVDLLMQPLQGLVVPCGFPEVAERWLAQRALQSIQERVAAKAERLPPAHLDGGPDGVRQDLEDLGILVRMTDGRVNIPDVFRVGYGLGRRGGVKPLGRGEGT